VEARSGDRLIWIQFSGQWCGNCRRLEKDSLSHPDVRAHAASDFVPVILRPDEHASLGEKFGLSVLPATVILRPGGQVVSKVEGYLGPAAYLEFLRTSLKRSGRLDPGNGPKVARAPVRRVPELQGFCPVTLVDDHRLAVGKRELSVEHEGRFFVFADRASRARFLEFPDSYLPRLAGKCPVSRVDRGEDVAGAPSWGVLYKGHLYLCGSDADRRRFLHRPGRYLQAEFSTCDHCWALSTLLAQDDRENGSTVIGRPALARDSNRERLARASVRSVHD
jgi:hypothetical protein